MNTIKPFLVREIPALRWKIQKDKSSLENLKTALSELENLKKGLDTNELPPEDHIKTQKKLLKALKESNIDLISLEMIKVTLTRKKFKQLSRKLETIGLPALSSTLLSLYAKSRALRLQATKYPGAALEIEAEYYTQLSLYQLELDRRTVEK